MEANLLNWSRPLFRRLFRLRSFCEKYYNFEDETIIRFTNEIHFYLSWLGYIAPLQQNGLSFCYPRLCGDRDCLYSRDGFRYSLGRKVPLRSPRNRDQRFRIDPPERVIVVTGANQGGKTPSRAPSADAPFGAIGLSVPGRDAALYLCDNILTHFEREEDINTLNGKLQDDLIRLRDLLGRATSRASS
jgi:hypothetical protein